MLSCAARIGHISPNTLSVNSGPPEEQVAQNKIVGVVCGMLCVAAPAWPATYPAGFRETLVTSSLVQPTHFTIAPDGRIFVAEKQGRVRVIKNGVLLAMPVLTVTVHTERYRGIMGIALDSGF